MQAPHLHAGVASQLALGCRQCLRCRCRCRRCLNVPPVRRRGLTLSVRPIAPSFDHFICNFLQAGELDSTVPDRVQRLLGESAHLHFMANVVVVQTRDEPSNQRLRWPRRHAPDLAELFIVLGNILITPLCTLFHLHPHSRNLAIAIPDTHAGNERRK